MGIQLIKERVGSQWLITSPDLPGLYVADPDLDKAEAAVPAAIRSLEKMHAKGLSGGTTKKPAAHA